MADALGPEEKEIDEGIEDLADRLRKLSLTPATPPSIFKGEM